MTHCAGCGGLIPDIGGHRCPGRRPPITWQPQYSPPPVKVCQRCTKWVTAFTAYQKALAEPYFDQDDESRQSNRAEVQRCFDVLKELAEG